MHAIAIVKGSRHQKMGDLGPCDRRFQWHLPVWENLITLKKRFEIKMAIVAGWIFALIAVPLGIFIRGFCISLTWGWFIAPITGWRTISLAEAVGVSMFFSIFSQPYREDDSKYQDKTAAQLTSIMVGKIIGGLLGPLLALGLAWIWHTFMIAPNSN